MRSVCLSVIFGKEASKEGREGGGILRIFAHLICSFRKHLIHPLLSWRGLFLFHFLSFSPFCGVFSFKDRNRDGGEGYRFSAQRDGEYTHTTAGRRHTLYPSIMYSSREREKERESLGGLCMCIFIFIFIIEQQQSKKAKKERKLEEEEEKNPRT